MPRTALLVAAVVLLASLPASGAGDLAAENRAFLERVAPGAPGDDVRNAAAYAADLGLRLEGFGAGPGLQAAGTGGLHAGELRYVCVGMVGGCDAHVLVPGAGDCARVPLTNWLYVWTPVDVVVEVRAGYLTPYTEGVLGLAPSTLAVDGGTFAGSFCVFSNTFFTFVAGDGVFIPG